MNALRGTGKRSPPRLLSFFLDTRGHVREELCLVSFNVLVAKSSVYIVSVCKSAKHSCLAASDEHLSGASLDDSAVELGRWLIARAFEVVPACGVSLLPSCRRAYDLLPRRSSNVSLVAAAPVAWRRVANRRLWPKPLANRSERWQSLAKGGWTGLSWQQLGLM